MGTRGPDSFIEVNLPLVKDLKNCPYMTNPNYASLISVTVSTDEG